MGVVVLLWIEICCCYLCLGGYVFSGVLFVDLFILFVDWSFARFTAPVVTTTSIILCFNKHRLTQVHLEMAIKMERVRELPGLCGNYSTSVCKIQWKGGTWSKKVTVRFWCWSWPCYVRVKVELELHLSFTYIRSVLRFGCGRVVPCNTGCVLSSFCFRVIKADSWAVVGVCSLPSAVLVLTVFCNEARCVFSTTMLRWPFYSMSLVCRNSTWVLLR